MIDLVIKHVIPAALDLLPPAMSSSEATAMLIAIGLQESRFLDRRQRHGPALGFWQFEQGGVRGVLENASVDVAIALAMREIRYDHTLDVEPVHCALEHNDVLACCFARCLLWTSPEKLPGPADAVLAWAIYIDTWRPGKPAKSTWSALYAEAWQRTLGGRTPPAILKA